MVLFSDLTIPPSTPLPLMSTLRASRHVVPFGTAMAQRPHLFFNTVYLSPALAFRFQVPYQLLAVSTSSIFLPLHFLSLLYSSARLTQASPTLSLYPLSRANPRAPSMQQQHRLQQQEQLMPLTPSTSLPRLIHNIRRHPLQSTDSVWPSLCVPSLACCFYLCLRPPLGPWLPAWLMALVK